MQLRTTHWILALVTAAGLIAADSAGPAKVMMEAARKLEVVDGDLQGAIKQYKTIAAKYAADHAIAADALIRTAECYQKLGDGESRRIYERVLREYGDQRDAVATARARLGSHAAGGSFQQVWTLPYRADVFGSISPDAQYLPYVGWEQNGDLFLHDFKTGTDRRLTNTGTDGVPGKSSEYAEETSFSRDGKYLAYSWFRGDHDRYELRLIDVKADGLSKPRLLFDHQDIGWISPDNWSPDGKSIAVQIQRNDKTAQIGIVSVSDGSLKVLKSVDWRGATRLVFSPDGKYIAYDVPAGETTEQRDIFVLATDASREITAVSGPGQDTVLGWSKDGTRLLFASDRGGSVGLWSVSFADGKIAGAPELLKRDIGRIGNLGLTDGGHLYCTVDNSGRGDIQVASIDFATGKLLASPSVAVPTYVGNNQFPDWSPDGKRLAYASVRGTAGPKYFVIGIRSIETGAVQELSLSPGFDQFNSLAWAPDGRSFIVRGRDNKGRVGIFRVDAQTGRSSILVEKADRGGLTPTAGISPDGEKVYFGRTTDQAITWIEKNLSSGAEKEMLQQQPFRASAVLSPDGRHLAIGTNNLPKPRTLSVFPVAGGALRELAHETEPLQIRGLGWAPDGSAIYAIKTPSELWRLPVDGSEPKRLGGNWDNNLTIGAFRVHPDGRQIVFEARTTRKPVEVWVMENFLPTANTSK